jgi:hypothetical protein
MSKTPSKVMALKAMETPRKQFLILAGRLFNPR